MTHPEASCLFPDEDEIARLVLGPRRGKKWREIVAVLEPKGLPAVDPLFGGRYWPAVCAYFDRRAGLRSSAPDRESELGERLTVPAATPQSRGPAKKARVRLQPGEVLVKITNVWETPEYLPYMPLLVERDPRREGGEVVAGGLLGIERRRNLLVPWGTPVMEAIRLAVQLAIDNAVPTVVVQDPNGLLSADQRAAALDMTVIRG